MSLVKYIRNLFKKPTIQYTYPKKITVQVPLTQEVKTRKRKSGTYNRRLDAWNERNIAVSRMCQNGDYILIQENVWGNDYLELIFIDVSHTKVESRAS